MERGCIRSLFRSSIPLKRIRLIRPVVVMTLNEDAPWRGDGGERFFRL
jgi:hypothetical protein